MQSIDTINTLANCYAGAPSAKLEDAFIAAAEKPLFGLVRRLLRGRTPTDDQLQEARMAVLAALRDYQPGRGAMSDLLPFHVQMALYRRRCCLIYLPQEQRQRLKALQNLETQFQALHGRKPTSDEIRYQLSLTPAQLELLQAARAASDFCDNPSAGLPGSPFEETSSEDPGYENARLKADIESAFSKLAGINADAAAAGRLRFLNDASLRTIAAFLRCRYSSATALVEIAEAFLKKELADHARP